MARTRLDRRPAHERSRALARRLSQPARLEVVGVGAGDFTRANPTRSLPPRETRTTPSISAHRRGCARPRLRPTRAFRRRALIDCARSMKRARRSSCTGGGTCSPAVFAVAPSTGEYMNAPTGCAASSQSSSSANSASVSPGKPTMKVLRITRSGHPRRQARIRSTSACAALHALQHARAAVLERHVEVGQHLALRHQRDHRVDVRVGIHVVQPDPDAGAPPRPRARSRPRLVGVAPLRLAVAQVDAVRAGVLGDHEDLAHRGLREASASRSTSSIGGSRARASTG